MNHQNHTVVLKLGGSVVKQTQDLSRLALIVALYKEHYSHVIVVVSAIKGYTDHLLNQAHLIHHNPPKRELDMLASVGERICASLLCIALDSLGILAKSYTGSQAGILTTEEHTHARILEVTPHRLYKSLDQTGVVVVAGFQGVSRNTKEITTLGRGGSDTTAVAMGIALQANRVVFFKDTAALFEADPKINPQAKTLSFCDYDKAIDLMNTPRFALHPRAIDLAKQNFIPLHFCGVETPLHTATLISAHDKHLDKIDFTKPGVYE